MIDEKIVDLCLLREVKKLAIKEKQAELDEVNYKINLLMTYVGQMTAVRVDKLNLENARLSPLFPYDEKQASIIRDIAVAIANAIVYYFTTEYRSSAERFSVDIHRNGVKFLSLSTDVYESIFEIIHKVLEEIDIHVRIYDHVAYRVEVGKLTVKLLKIPAKSAHRDE